MPRHPTYLWNFSRRQAPIAAQELVRDVINKVFVDLRGWKIFDDPNENTCSRPAETDPENSPSRSKIVSQDLLLQEFSRVKEKREAEARGLDEIPPHVEEARRRMRSAWFDGLERRELFASGSREDDGSGTLRIDIFEGGEETCKDVIDDMIDDIFTELDLESSYVDRQLDPNNPYRYHPKRDFTLAGTRPPIGRSEKPKFTFI